MKNTSTKNNSRYYNQNQKKYVLSGKHIYRTNSGQAIYYNEKEKAGYKIPSNIEGLFQTLLLRYYVCFIIGLLIYFSILPNLLLSIAIPLILLFIMEWKYRSILKNVTRIANYKPAKLNHDNKEELLDKDSNTQLILKFLFFLIIGILFIVNCFISEDLKTIPLAVFCSYLAAIISLYFSYRIFRILWKKRSN